MERFLKLGGLFKGLSPWEEACALAVNWHLGLIQKTTQRPEPPPSPCPRPLIYAKPGPFAYPGRAAPSPVTLQSLLTQPSSLVAQLVKNLPAMWETWVQSLGWEDPLEKGTATHSSILAWRIPWTV